jgi:hypothetical protein
MTVARHPQGMCNMIYIERERWMYIGFAESAVDVSRVIRVPERVKLVT